MKYDFWEESPGKAPAAKEVRTQCDKRFAEKLYDFLENRLGKYSLKNLWDSKKLMPIPGSSKRQKLVELRFPLLGVAIRFLSIIIDGTLHFLRFTKDKSGGGKLKERDKKVAEDRASIFWKHRKGKGG